MWIHCRSPWTRPQKAARLPASEGLGPKKWPLVNHGGKSSKKTKETVVIARNFVPVIRICQAQSGQLSGRVQEMEEGLGSIKADEYGKTTDALRARLTLEFALLLVL